MKNEDYINNSRIYYILAKRAEKLPVTILHKKVVSNS